MMTKIDISHEIRASTTQVARLLAEVREQGYVRIEFNPPKLYELGEQLKSKYGLQAAVVVSYADDLAFLRRMIGKAAAQYFEEVVRTGATVAISGGIWSLSPQIAAGSSANEAAGAEPGHGLHPVALAGVAAMLIIAKLSGEIFERFRQPAVLGELIGGIFIGNLTLLGVTMAEPLKTDIVINALAELGVIILLFEVGIESNLGEMLEVGWSSLLVAIAGVVTPFFLGWGVAAYFLPGEATLSHIFIGATLCATSVGIAARVLKDLDALRSREARIILGAAVIDDVLGLLVLAVVAGAIKAEAAGAALSSWQIVIIALKAFSFLVGAILCGRYVISRLLHQAGRLETRGVLLALSISFCFLLAWLAALVGLAPIVGAFAARLVLDETHFESFRDRGEHRLEELLRPVSAVIATSLLTPPALKWALQGANRSRAIKS